MSSKPNKEGVETLRTTLREHRVLSKRLVEARAVAAQIPELEARATEQHRRVLKLLESMDVKADGNMGWEGRIMWFLGELERQSSEPPTEKDPED